MKKKYYKFISICLFGICFLGLCLVGIRIFAKKVLIGKWNIENYYICSLADYNWGDRLERTWREQEGKKNSARLNELEKILSQAPISEEQESDLVKQGVLERFENIIKEKEESITKYCNDKFLLYKWLRKVSQGFDNALGWKIAFARESGDLYTLTTGYEYSAVEASDETAYTDKIVEEARVAQIADIPYLYIQYPYRVDENNSQVPWGAVSCENENADAVLDHLKGEQIDCLDLREALYAEGWNNNEGFYETDGHWTTRSGFLSAGIIADFLNEKYDYTYDLGKFDEDNYETVQYDVNSYMVDEKVELFLPDFATNLAVYDAYRDEEYVGEFTESCFDMTKAETEEYSSVLTAYSASRIRNSYLFEYENLERTNNDKRILVCSNSFSWHLIPYMALDTHYIDYVYNMTPQQLQYYIEQLQPDLILVMDRV